jgi:hypothetical protein
MTPGAAAWGPYNSHPNKDDGVRVCGPCRGAIGRDVERRKRETAD